MVARFTYKKASTPAQGDGPILKHIFKGHKDIIKNLVFLHDHVHIVSASLDGTMRKWNCHTGRLVGKAWKGKGGRIRALALSPDGQMIACGREDGNIQRWNVGGKMIKGIWTGHSGWVQSLSWSPSGGQLWDTESHQPRVSQPPRQHHNTLYCVSFSQDGRYLATGGEDKKVTLWMFNDVAPQVAPPTLSQQGHGQLEATQQPEESRSQSPSLDADATGGDGIIEEDPYHNFFQSSQSSLPAGTSEHPHNLSSARRFWNTISRRPLPSIPLRKHKFFSRARSNLSLEPATTNTNQSTPEGKVRAGEDEQGEKYDDRCSANDPLGAKDTGKQSDVPPGDVQNPPDDPPPHAKLDNEHIWKQVPQARGKDPTNTKHPPAMKRPEVVLVSAVRGFQGYVAMKRVRKTKLPAVTYSAPLTAVHANSLSQPVPLSQAYSVQTGQSSHTVPVNVAQSSQATGGSSSCAPPSHFVTTYHTSHDSDSHSSIEGSCNRFLHRMCFPCGHFHKDSSGEYVS